MSVAEKLNIVSENLPKVYNAGYEKGKNDNLSNKEEQEKTIEITKNGTTEVLPDEGKVLSKVSVEVDVPSNDSLEISLIQRDMTEVVIPEGVTEIGEGAFYGCRSLTDISIPNSVTDIMFCAFFNCKNLKSVIIPDSVTNMCLFKNNPLYYPADTFRYSGVEKVVLSKNLKTVPSYLFREAKFLKKMDIPSSVTAIGRNIFDSCEEITEIIINSNPQEWFFPQTFVVGGKKLVKVVLPQGFNHNSLNLSCSTLYSVETIVSWGEALFDRTGLDPYTLTIGSENIEKLSDEQIAIFTNKNWTLA